MAEPARSKHEGTKAQWSSATDTIAADIMSAAAQIIADSRISRSGVGTLLNAFLGRYIPWPYHVGPGKAIDSTGAESSKFESAIHTSPNATESVPADNLACSSKPRSRLSRKVSP
jgi:hypothetical protein